MFVYKKKPKKETSEKRTKGVKMMKNINPIENVGMQGTKRRELINKFSYRQKQYKQPTWGKKGTQSLKDGNMSSWVTTRVLCNQAYNHEDSEFLELYSVHLIDFK